MNGGAGVLTKVVGESQRQDTDPVAVDKKRQETVDRNDSIN